MASLNKELQALEKQITKDKDARKSMKLGGASMALGGAATEMKMEIVEIVKMVRPFYHNAPLMVKACQSCDAISVHFLTSVHEKDNFSTV